MMNKYLPPHPSHFITPQKPWQLLGFVSLTSAVALLTTGQLLNFVIGAIFILIFLFYWVYVERRQVKQAAISVSRGMPRTAKGLILLVSPYHTQTDDELTEDLLSQRLQAIYDTEQPSLADFGGIRIHDSNLLPQIRAIDYHAQKNKLEKIWLICTEPEGKMPGSELSGDILQKYVEYHFGKHKFTIHRNAQYTVNAQDYGTLWHLVEDIFRSSGYRDEVIVADVTGGTKMMSVAIAMACVQPKRSMQYMDSKRDWQGKPLSKGEMMPVGINFDPIFYQVEE